MQNLKTVTMACAAFAAMGLVGCTSTIESNKNIPGAAAAYDVIPAERTIPTEYHIRTMDKLNIRVYGENDLSADDLLVDEGGNIQVGMIGLVKAAGKTTEEVTHEIAYRLNQSYIINPQVTVSMKAIAPREVSVEGNVKKPGIYQIDRSITLLSALSLAESPNDTAKLNEVYVFRDMGDKTVVAKFNVKQVRSGLAPDPTIIDGDIVVVGESPRAALWQDFLKTFPLLNAFVVIARN